MPQKPGTILENRYRVEALLGQGGMGAVYKAYDQRLQMAVALKENSLITADARAQFEREALVLARLHHTNLPKVIDHFVTADGLQYLVMTFIEGVNLAELPATRGRQTPAEMVTWLAQICDALTYLHSQNPPIIHRDIKPQNIKITPNGHVFLVDFRLSKVGSAYQSTASGALGVTPGFSPWEQYGHGHTDQRSDVYALAATLYAMLTGETPPDSVQRGLAGLALKSPRDLNPALTPALEQAILHRLETQPGHRPQSVAALRHEVEMSLTTAQASTPANRPTTTKTPATFPVLHPAPPPRERRRLGWVLVVVGFLAVVLFAAGMQAMRGREGSATAPASPVAAESTKLVRTEMPIISEALTPTLTIQNTRLIYATNAAAVPTSTHTPSPTPALTPTASPTPTPTPMIGKIVFAGNPGGFSHLYLVAGNGRNRREITYGPEQFWNPMLSHDGARLAFASKVNGNTEVFVADGEGRNARPISNHPAEDDHPSWFPNNTELAFASRRYGAWDIYRMRADGSELRRLTWNGGDNRFSVVSPDGQQIAYLSQSEEYPLIQLIVMNADGSAPRAVYSYRSNKQRDDSSRYLYRPDWSPDGTRLAMGADVDNDGIISIVIVNIASGSPTRFIADGNSPAWNPDGLRMVYKPAGVRQVLYVVDQSGQRLYQLTDSSSDAWSPDWSP